MAKDEFESQDDRDDVGIFIHSELDDYGLNPLEFRVYGRLARRAGKKGKFTQSVPHMAEEFGVHKRSVQRALQLLVLCGLADAKVTIGRPTVYRLNPRRKWKDKAELLAIREYIRNPKGAPLGAWVTKNEGNDLPSPGVRPTEPGGAPPQPHKGIPLKVLPEGTPTTARAREGQVKPRLVDSDDDFDAKALQIHYNNIRTPDLFDYDILTVMGEMFPSLAIRGPNGLYAQWAESRIINRGIGRRPRMKSTLREYALDLENFLRKCEVNQQAKLNPNSFNGNGNGNTKSDYRGPVKDTRTRAEMDRVAACPGCHGTGTEVVPGNGARPCKHQALEIVEG